MELPHVTGSMDSIQGLNAESQKDHMQIVLTCQGLNAALLFDAASACLCDAGGIS